ncbi:DUF397 domain-containing protein [Streptomyces echinoruber]|uniref:DUF397 domain-containing protein n=1 Tax=Streptomyces echinoruber TaxID=68898 RepID=A0A918R0Z5_9ACTN|nr:DUF397 domain-containing protein [Streptomyces echinoruber]GGZ80682.1 hypothetical protein GCM10010389_18190 [Streptomyces echinoruber]
MQPTVWKKSTYSGDSSNCVEVAATPTPTTIHIRDSKTTHGPHLTVARTTWTTFLAYAAVSLSSPDR